MSLTQAAFTTASVAVASAGLAAVAAEAVLQALRQVRARWASAAWLAAVAPLLTPAILPGYVYGDLSLSLVRQPLLNHLLYLMLLTARLTPAAVLLLHLAPPPPMSAQASHCAALLLPCNLSRWKQIRMSLLGPLRQRLAAFCLVLLLAMQDFELASLLGINTWTVWLYEYQQGGGPSALAQSLTRASSLIALELAALAGTAFLLSNPEHASTEGGASSPSTRGGWAAAGVGWILLSLAACLLWPLWTLTASMGSLARAFSQVAGPMLSSTGLALAASLAAMSVMHAVSRSRGLPRTGLMIALVSPGLMGSVALGLLVMAAFQALSPGLHRWTYDTSLPLLLALLALLLPLAWLVQCLGSGATHRAGNHLALALKQAQDPAIRAASGALLRQMVWRPLALSWALLAMLAYFDLGASSLLYPSDSMPVSVALYQQMHYGRNAQLSAMTLLSMLAPTLWVMLALGVGATGPRRAARGQPGGRL